MKEVVTIHVGKCGNTIGSEFWEMICREHGLDANGIHHGTLAQIQLPRINSFFTEIKGMRYMPRAVLIDLDKESLDGVKSTPYGRIFRPDNFVHGHGGTGNNWAKGHLTEGVALKESVLDVVRREAENTDCLQSFQVLHSTGGGTGSGLGSLIIDRIRDEYPKRHVSTFTVVPSPNDPKSSLEVYNTVMALSHLIAESDCTYVIDNYALHQVFLQIPSLDHYTMHDLNYIISSAISGITTSMRFCGENNTDYRKIAVNFVPLPRMHFFVPAQVPLVGPKEVRHRAPVVHELFHQMFNGKVMFADCDIKTGRFLTLAALFRGKVCIKDVFATKNDVQNKNSSKFVEWVPDNFKTFVYDIPPTIINISATMIANTTSIRQVFTRLKNQFYVMYRRKAFLAPLKGEGMDEVEFEEAVTNMQELIREYKESQDTHACSSAKESECVEED